MLKRSAEKMKEDILEQLVDDYLQCKGYFTRHNLKFRPNSNHPEFHSTQDSNHSDIDVLGLKPSSSGSESVYAVSCKSWQSGFRVSSKLCEIKENKIISGRESWKFFRELTKPKWSAAFIDAVEAATGSRKFTYILAVTRVIGDRREWEEYGPFIDALEGNPIKVIDLSQMLEEFEHNNTTTLASSDIGRLLQVVRAAKIEG